VPSKIKIDTALLADVGLDMLIDDEQDLLLKHLRSTLAERTGRRIVNQLSAEELGTWRRLRQQGDEAAASTYIAEHVTDQGAIAREEWARLRSELIESVPGIRGASEADPWPRQAAVGRPASPDDWV